MTRVGQADMRVLCVWLIPAAGAPLLGTNSPAACAGEQQIPVRGLLSNTSLRGPAILAAAIMCLQQLSGVNAVIFYSTPILKSLLPASAGLIGIGITAVNAIMTLPAIFLVDVST